MLHYRAVACKQGLELNIRTLPSANLHQHIKEAFSVRRHFTAIPIRNCPAW